jgi:hypothetical protein
MNLTYLERVTVVELLHTLVQATHIRAAVSIGSHHLLIQQFLLLSQLHLLVVVIRDSLTDNRISKCFTWLSYSFMVTNYANIPNVLFVM